MILEKDFKEQDSEIIGSADERIEMGIDTENINHLMMIMSTNMYQNPIGSIVREYSSNAIDANVDGNSTDPVIVRLQRDPVGNYFFEVQDFGPGLDDKDFRTIISKYGKSTKRDRDDQLGYFGLGCKSAFSYSSMFNYTCIKGGKERKYLLYKADTGFAIDLLYEKDSTERNGVTVRIPVKSHDIYNFKREIRNQLAYFDNVYFDIEYDDLNTDYTLFQSDDFQYCNLITHQEMHITLGRVNYPISWSALAIRPVNIPIALRFGLDSGIFPIPNRENLIWNDKTKKLVMDKIAVVSDWFVEKYNKDVKEIDSLAKAWEFISTSTHNVIIEDKKFDVTVLEQYSKHSFKEVEVKGINLLKPSVYKAKFGELLRDYRIVGEFYNGTLRTKNVYQNMHRLLGERDSAILLDDDVLISGFFREYLKTLGHTLFLKKQIEVKEPDLEYYKQQLYLVTRPRNTWRAIIKEFETVKKEFVKELVEDGRGIQDTDDFKTFWEEHKSKKKSIAKKKVVLTKTREDVSIYYPRPRYGGGFMFERKVLKLDELHKNGFISVIMDDEEQKKMETYAQVFVKQKTLQFARIGVQDLKKITKLKLNNFMTLKDLEKTKAFRRTATALKAKQLIDVYDKLVSNKVEVVRSCAGKFSELYKEVKKYAEKNVEFGYYSPNQALINSIVSTAEVNNMWDTTFIHVIKKFENALKDFSFITKLKEPNYNDPGTVLEEYSELINNLLLFKKLRYENKLGNLEICVKNDVPLDETKLVNTPTAQVAVA